MVTRKGSELFSLPVTVFALLMLLGFWFLLFALALGLFCGLRYSFQGPNLGKKSINDAMNRAAEVAENVKEELRTHANAAENDAEKQENGEDKAN